MLAEKPLGFNSCIEAQDNVRLLNWRTDEAYLGRNHRKDSLLDYS
jgi:hypothetical protein